MDPDPVRAGRDGARGASTLSAPRPARWVHLTSWGDGRREERPGETDLTPVRRRLRDWVFTVPFVFLFGLILAGFDLLQRLARQLGPRPHEVVVAAMQWCLLQALRVCGTRLEIERSPEVKPRTPYIVVANHQSMYDIPILGGLLFTNYTKYVAKKELARWIPGISYNLRRGGNAIIDRRNRGQALPAIRRLGETVRERGVSAVIYPEGTRARAGQLREFKIGGALQLLAAAPEAAVVPVAIDGSWKLLRHNLCPVPFGTRIRVHIGRPLPRRPDEDPASLVGEAEAQIRSTIERWRGSRDRAAEPDPRP